MPFQCVIVTPDQQVLDEKCAQVVLTNARKMNLGTEVDF